jgi:hypothetical protein
MVAPQLEGPLSSLKSRIKGCMNALFTTNVEILIHHRGRVFWGEHVQVENPIDRIFDLISIFIYITQNRYQNQWFLNPTKSLSDNKGL